MKTRLTEQRGGYDFFVKNLRMLHEEDEEDAKKSVERFFRSVIDCGGVSHPGSFLPGLGHGVHEHPGQPGIGQRALFRPGLVRCLQRRGGRDCAAGPGGHHRRRSDVLPVGTGTGGSGCPAGSCGLLEIDGCRHQRQRRFSRLRQTPPAGKV